MQQLGKFAQANKQASVTLPISLVNTFFLIRYINYLAFLTCIITGGVRLFAF